MAHKNANTKYVKITTIFTLGNTCTFLNISLHLPFIKAFLRKKYITVYNMSMYLKITLCVYIQLLITFGLSSSFNSFIVTHLVPVKKICVSEELQNDDSKSFRKQTFDFVTVSIHFCIVLCK